MRLDLEVENELPHVLRAIHSDNGTELKNPRFDTFCSDQGLEHQYSSPYTPQQNGVVERKNRTLVEMARSMLDGIGLLESTGLRQLTPLVMCPIVFSCVLSCTRPLMSCDLDANPVLTISEFLVAGVLC